MDIGLIGSGLVMENNIRNLAIHCRAKTIQLLAFRRGGDRISDEKNAKPLLPRQVPAPRPHSTKPRRQPQLAQSNPNFAPDTPGSTRRGHWLEVPWPLTGTADGALAAFAVPSTRMAWAASIFPLSSATS
jgi:hypothetical protein